MNVIQELQDWFVAQCNGEWEHRLAINITTCDNPGWVVKIDVRGTNLETRNFDIVSKNVSQKFIDQSLGKEALPFVPENPLAEEWMVCFVKDGKFEGAGDARRLEDILKIFLEWAKSA